jgi:hypothetical protein
LRDFTQQTGIAVKHLPTPETALESSSPDVDGVDVIWPGVLSEELMDLKPYLATELPSINADVVASYTVKGKLVAVPYHSDIGVLLYRKDLLRRYGYRALPRTWDELEQMAARIQDDGAQQPSARQQLQHIHTPQSIDQELAHLTRDLELTSQQQQQCRPLIEEHHDKIQALLDKNPTASRQELGPQIHAISDETHGKIHALLTDHQKELEKAMEQGEHSGGENRRSTPPAVASPEPSSSASGLRTNCSVRTTSLSPT